MEDFELKEKLFRKISHDPNMWKEGKPTSAAFKDSKGCSVDRSKQRTEKESTDALLKRWGKDEVKAIVNVTVGECAESEVLVKYDPTYDNEYHSTINRSEQIAALTGAQAKKISRCCHISYEENC